MGVFNSVRYWLAAKLAGVKSSPPKSKGERVLAGLLPSGYGWPGGWSQDRWEQVQHYKHWIHVAISARTDKIKQLTPTVAIVHEADAPEVKKGLTRRFVKAIGPVKPHEELEPVAANHPLVRLLANPNEPDVAGEFWEELEMFLQLTGNAYIWVVPSRLGLPLELWVIPSQWVFPRRVDPKSERLIDFYEIRPWGASSGALRFPTDEVIHLKTKHPLSKLDGYSKLAAIAQWIDTEESISASRWSQFKNRARPEMWIELDKEMHDPDDDEIKRIQGKISEKLKGEYRTGEPIVMAPGAKIVPLNWSPEEMGYIESSEQVKRMILGAFRVPPAVLGDMDGMTYGSVLAAQAAFCTFAINPELAYFGQVLTEKLAHRYDRRLRIFWDDCTPNDPAQLNADLALDMQHGIRTLNEARAVRGLEPYQHGGDDPMLGMGLAPMPLNTGEDDLAGQNGLELPSKPMLAASGSADDDQPEPPAPPRPAKRAKRGPALKRLDLPRLKSRRLVMPTIGQKLEPSRNGTH